MTTRSHPSTSRVVTIVFLLLQWRLHPRAFRPSARVVSSPSSLWLSSRKTHPSLVAWREEGVTVSFGGKHGNIGNKRSSNRTLPNPYGWMANASSVRLQEHLQEEADYVNLCGQHLGPLRDVLEKEFRQHCVVDNFTQLLFRQGGYLYFTRSHPSQPYPVHCRIPLERMESTTLTQEVLMKEAEDTVVWDENALVASLSRGCCRSTSQPSFFATHTWRLWNATHVVVSVDLVGNERYAVYLVERNGAGASTNDGNVSQNLWLMIANETSGEFVVDTTYVHVIQVDPITQRPFRWYRHRYSESDGLVRSELLLQEKDEGFWGELAVTNDDRYVLWTSRSMSGHAEVWTLSTCRPTMLESSPNATCLLSRDHPWSDRLLALEHVEHNQEWWALVTYKGFGEYGNTTCSEGLYRLDLGHSFSSATTHLEKIDVDFPASTSGDPFEMGSSEPISLRAILPFTQHVILQGRSQNGLNQLWIISLGDQPSPGKLVAHALSPTQTPGYVALARRQDYASGMLLVQEESMIAPPRMWEYDLAKGTWKMIQEQVVAGYDSQLYTSERHWVPSTLTPNIRIPVSIVYPKLTPFPTRVHLLGYAAYGHSLEPSFSALRISLLQRGVACVIAHGRGGGELGHNWYQAGKGSLKCQSIQDFVDVAEWLLKQNVTTPEWLGVEGRSAGGLLVAAAMNRIPSLIRIALLGVPFLDVLTTLSDPALPLSKLEWEEYGNPSVCNDFETILAYDPIHNLPADMQSFPNCLLVGGMQDSRVPYWGLLKYAASIRYLSEHDVSRPICCVRLDTDAGHSFGTNRDKYYCEMAFLYAFFLDQLGVQQ